MADIIRGRVKRDCVDCGKESEEIRFCHGSEAWLEVEAWYFRGQNPGYRGVFSTGVGEEGREPISKGSLADPKIKPKGGCSSMANRDSGGIPKFLETLENGSPGWRIKDPGIAKVVRVRPAIFGAEPRVPGGSGRIVEFC